MGSNNVLSIFKIVVFGLLMSYQLVSRLVIETASQRPATLKDFRTQEFALERQTQLWELSKFEPIGTRQVEIAKKFCRLQIREECSRLNIATQNAIGFALSRFLDPAPGEDVPTINLKKVLSTCRDKFCSVNGAPVGHVLDEGGRSALCWPKPRPKARGNLATATVERISPMVEIRSLIS